MVGFQILGQQPSSLRPGAAVLTVIFPNGSHTRRGGVCCGGAWSSASEFFHELFFLSLIYEISLFRRANDVQCGRTIK